MTETTQAVEVTQADRDAAAAYMDRVKSRRWSIEGIVSGGCDNTSIVQSFARHRINTIEQCAKVAEDLPAWWARHIAKVIRNLAHKEQGETK